MLKRFVIYGILGWTMEIVWTGLSSLLARDWRLAGTTYLWMFPIYGAALLLEPVHDAIRPLAWPLRGLVWLALIWGMEYASGSALILLTGACPWNYGPWFPAVNGLIRLDFAPAWMVAGFAFERLHDRLIPPPAREKEERPPR